MQSQDFSGGEIGARVAHDVPLRFDTLNLRITQATIALAEVVEDSNIFHVYAADDGAEITKIALAAPTDERRRWAYALDGTTLYVVTPATPEDPGTKLYKASPGGDLALVTTLESAGADVGVFWDFAVEDGTMVFVESGRIWSFDLAANQAQWLGNVTEIVGTINFASDGVVFATVDGMHFFEFATGQVIDLAASIAAAPVRRSAGQREHDQPNAQTSAEIWDSESWLSALPQPAQWLDAQPHLSQATRALAWDWKSGFTVIELPWALQLRSVGDGTSHIVMQAGRYSGLTTFDVGFAVWIRVAGALHPCLGAEFQAAQPFTQPSAFAALLTAPAATSARAFVGSSRRSP